MTTADEIKKLADEALRLTEATDSEVALPLVVALHTAIDALIAERDALKDALQALKNTDWTEVMREGALVTWGDASTLGYRVFERIDTAMQGEKE